MESSTGNYPVTVRPGGGWKDKLASFGNRSPSTTPEAQSPTGETDSDPSQVTQVLAACKNEIIALWDDAIVRGVLERHGVYLQDDSGLCVLRASFCA
jgi:guanine nucleotide-binding protein subunit alpha